MTFDWADLFLFSAIAQGILMAVALFSIQGSNRSPNCLLGLLLLLASCKLIGRMLIWQYPNHWQLIWLVPVDSFIFIYGAILYFFIKKLIFKEVHIRIAHFLPVIGHFMFFLYFASIGKTTFEGLVETKEIGFYFVLIELAGLVCNCLYVGLSLWLLRQYLSAKNGQISFEPGFVRFLNYFLWLNFTFVTAWAANFILLYAFRIQLPYFNYSSLWITIAASTYLAGYYMLVRPEVFRVARGKKSQPKRERMPKAEIETLKMGIAEKMETGRLFENSRLTLIDLAESVGTSANNLSWLLNNVYKTSFYDFVNRYRVTAFQEKVAQGEHLTKTILGLAYEVGFHSKSTFNKVFKAETGLTPSAYIKQQRQTMEIAN